MTGRAWMVVFVALAVGCGKKAKPEAAVEPTTAPTELGFDPGAPLPDKVALAIAKLESGAPEDLDLAVAILEQSLPQDPGGATELNLAIALQRRGDVAAAIPHYEAVVARHPEWPETWVYLGSAQERLGRRAEAMGTYERALGVDTENMGARVALIAALRADGRPEDAIEQAKAALKVNANSLAVYNNFALAYLDKGDTTLARFILQKALQGIEGAQTNAYLHTNLGWSHYLDGNTPAAVQSLEKAVELEPGLVPALVYLATVFLEDRNYEDMIPLLETARENDPENADVHLNLGIAYRGMERFDEARAAYATAMELRPEDPDPWFNLGILLGDSLKDYQPSIEAFGKYVELGGTEQERAQAYIAAVTKERETAERRRKAEEARKKREEQRKREQELLRKAQEEAAAAAPQGEAASAEAQEGDAASSTDGADAPEPADASVPPESGESPESGEPPDDSEPVDPPQEAP